MDDLEHTLSEELSKGIGKELDDSQALLNRMRENRKTAPPAVNQIRRSQLEEFMSTSARMIDMQRGYLQETESAYQLDRVKLLDSYRIKLENLKFEANQAVRKLDEKFQHDTADIKKLLERLHTMRDMPL